MTESAAIQIDLTPCRGVPFYPHDTGTIRLMQVYGLHKGVPVTTLPKCALINYQGSVSAEIPRVHARIPPGQPHSYSSQTEHNHTHLTPQASESNGLETLLPTDGPLLTQAGLMQFKTPFPNALLPAQVSILLISTHQVHLHLLVP